MENIAKRIGPKIVEEATRKGKQVSQDVLTEKGVSPEVSVQPDIDQKQAPTGQRAKVFPSSIKVIADNITGVRHNSDREAFSQGVTNMTSGIFGGISTATATMFTVSNIKFGGKTYIFQYIRDKSIYSSSSELLVRRRHGGYASRSADRRAGVYKKFQKWSSYKAHI